MYLYLADLSQEHFRNLLWFIKKQFYAILFYVTCTEDKGE